MIRRPPRSTLFPSTPLSRSRPALGAPRRRVLRQLLVESLVPSVVGAALATAVGQVATRSLLRAIPEGVRIDMPYLTNVGLDARVIGVIVGLATLLAVGFGVGAGPVITQVAGPEWERGGVGERGEFGGWP